MSWNFSETESINGIKSVNTRCELPIWCTAELIRTFKLPVNKIKFKFKKVKSKSIDFSDVVADMVAVDWIDRKYQAIDSDKLIPIISSNIPVDNNEILEWMHPATAASFAIGVMSENYSSIGNCGGSIYSTSGDAYIPGVHTVDLSFVSEPANIISNRGYSKIKSPYGIDKLNILSKLTIIKNKLLGWAVNPFVGIKQWVGSLVKWVKVATSPIHNGHICNVRIGGLSSPQFLTHIPPKFGLRNKVYMRVASDKNQTLVITARNPTNYTEQYGKLRIPLKSNSVSDVRFDIISYTGVPPMLMQFESNNNGLFDIQYYNIKSSIIPFSLPFM